MTIHAEIEAFLHARVTEMNLGCSWRLQPAILICTEESISGDVI